MVEKKTPPKVTRKAPANPAPPKWTRMWVFKPRFSPVEVVVLIPVWNFLAWPFLRWALRGLFV
jgi:hypothetical protein